MANGEFLSGFYILVESNKPKSMSIYITRQFYRTPSLAKAHMQSDCCIYSVMKAGLKMTGDVGSSTPLRQEVCSSIFTLMRRSGSSICTAVCSPAFRLNAELFDVEDKGQRFKEGCAGVVCTHRSPREILDVGKTFRLQCFSAGRDCGAVRGADPSSMWGPGSLPYRWSWFWSRKNMLIQQP